MGWAGDMGFSRLAERGWAPLIICAQTFADGRRGELPVAGGQNINIGDRWTIARCIVLPQGSDPLIGQVIMEELDLIADCLNQTLAPRPESPDRPLLRV